MRSIAPSTEPLVVRLLEKAPQLSGRGLDLGCGTGFSLEELTARAPDVAWIGADCSRRMLDLARGKPGLRAALLCEARAEALPFADKSFDVVVANFSWHWFGAEAGHAGAAGACVRVAGFLPACPCVVFRPLRQPGAGARVACQARPLCPPVEPGLSL